MLSPIHSLLKYYPFTFWGVLLFEIVAVTVIIIALLRKKCVNLIPLVIYYLVILFLTAFGRIKSSNYKVILLPSYFGIEQFLNLLIFAPIGFFSATVKQERQLYFVVCLGFVLSMFIELLQLILKKGTFETMDLLANTIGAAIGYGVYWIYNKLKRRR